MLRLNPVNSSGIKITTPLPQPPAPPSGETKETKISNLHTLISPGFNDQHVLLFAGKKKLAKSEYTPIDPAEATAMQVFKECNPSVVQIKMYNKKEYLVNGSGSIIDDKGHVLTNSHVLDEGNKIVVILHDGKEIKAKLIAKDPDTDLAIIKLKLPPEKLSDIKPIKMGQTYAELQQGQTVFALGSPVNLQNSMTKGIICGLDRKTMSPVGRLNNHFIQTDAHLNKGNSGGPLVNSRGELIGINTQVTLDTQGLGLAISIDTAKNVAKQLITKGRISRPYLGLYDGYPVSEMDSATKKRLGISKLTNGACIKKVLKGSPLEKAGLKGSYTEVKDSYGEKIPAGGDIITKINNLPIDDTNDIFDILDTQKAGSELEIEYISLKKEDKKTFKASKVKKAIVIVEDTPKKVK